LCPAAIIHPNPSDWFVRYLTPFPTAPRVALALLAIDRSLIMPVWTIFIELIGSLFMPLIVSIALTKTRLFNWLLVGMGFAAYFLAYAPHRLNALSHLFEFALGAWLASRKHESGSRNSLPQLLGAAVVLVFFRFAWFASLNGHAMPLSFDYDDPVSSTVEAVAAFFLVGALASEHGRIQLLRNRKAIWLGNISYSLYLIHFSVAIFVAKILSRFFSAGTNPIVATAILMALGLAISCALAFLMYRFIEIPLIALGRRVSSGLS
jgi:peptidoglycan/LPS O-acetylase OafA/YrhL